MPLELLGETAMRDHPVIQAVQKVRHWISEAVGHVCKEGLRRVGTSGTSPRPADEPATRRREAEGQGMTVPRDDARHDGVGSRRPGRCSAGQRAAAPQSAQPARLPEPLTKRDGGTRAAAPRRVRPALTPWPFLSQLHGASLHGAGQNAVIGQAIQAPPHPTPPPPRSNRNSRRAALALTFALTLGAAAPALAQQVRITSTPANGTHYVAGEAITTRLDLPAHLHSGNPATSRMKLDIGPRQRRATSTTPYSFALAGVNYSYTVVADDVDTDGIGIPANAIVVSGQPWRTAGSAFINLNNAALSSQAAHKVIGSTAYISATNPSPLTEATLNGATVTIALDGLTYASGVTDSDFLLATTVQNLSIASVGSVSSGDTAATLTLAFTGDTGFELDGTLAATIAGSAHSGTSFLTTGSVPVLATDTAPSFGSGSVADRSYRLGTAVTEFQAPAATGGNGALTYSASNLPAGLVFDADGAGACPGAEPREICGTPTAASGAHTVTITAADEDSNTAASDAATLTFQIAVTGATLASTPTPLTEANLNGARLTVGLLDGATFTGVSAASFELVTAPAIPGLSIGGVTGGASGSSSATLTLAAGAGYGFSTPATIAVRALAAAHSGAGDLVSDALAVSPTAGATVSRSRLALDEAPGADNANQGTYTLVLDSPLTGCGAGVSVGVASNNADVTPSPATLNFTADDWSAPQTVTVTAAHDADYADDTATISHGISVACAAAGYATTLAIDSLTVTVDDDEDPTASISSTSPAALTEANLHQAGVTVALAYATFGGGVTTASFELVTGIPNVSVALVSSVSSGDTTATLTLAFTGGFSAVETLAVKVKAAAHTGSTDITTGTVNVTPTPGIALSRASLALEEDPAAGGATNANVGAYTVALTADPTTAGGVYCGVNIEATSNNADVTIDTDSTPLTERVFFDGANWNTPQTITVTAASDADGVDAAATISHSRVGSACGGGFFGAPSLPSLMVAVNDDETPTAAIASPSILTAATLNGAAVSVSLSLTTFASGVGASSFELVTGAAGVSIASATATAGGTSAALTLSHTGTLAADAKLAVKVLAAAHAGDADLTTGQIDVLVSDTAPSFGGATVADQLFPEGAAIAPFQLPAASGGNGALSYAIEALFSATGLPTGLKFDASGTDAGGCAAGDFPSGTDASWATAPRTVCGTLTRRASVNNFTVFYQAHDADSNREDSDSASLSFGMVLARASITSTSPASLSEANLNTATVSLSLARAAFASGVTAASFELVTAIPGLSVSQVSGVTTGGTTATLTLAFTGDFSAVETLAVKVKAAAHNRAFDLTTGALTIDPQGLVDTAPSFGGATVADQLFPEGVAIAPFQLPAASGGNGALSYAIEALHSATGLPTGLKFDASGTDAGGCAAGDFPPGTAASWATAPRTVCGTLTRRASVNNFTVFYQAHDADSNREDSDSASLSFGMVLARASITSTSPASLSEANLNTATVSLSLAQAAFAAGVTTASFELVTAIPGLSISQVSGGASGTTTATLTLAFTGDFSAIETLAVKVKAAAHNRAFDLTTGALTIDPQGLVDTAPSFGGATVADQLFPEGVAIAPFQLPAASGGNGALSYAIEALHSATGLPTGLKFDASGTDAGGCAAGDFPPGTDASWATAPRTVCGTLTRRASVNNFTVFYQAHDADSNREDSDSASLSFGMVLARASITSTSPASLSEANLNTATVSLSLAQAAFASGVTAASFELVTAIPGLSVSQVSGVTTGGTTATLTLAFTGDFSATQTLAVKVKAAAHSRAFDLTTGAVTVAPTDTEPAFPAVAARGFPTNVAIAPFQIPAATGGNGALGYAVAGLPDGLKFDLTGTDAGGCAAGDFPPGTDASWATAPRTICGTPTRDVTSVVVVTATDEDGDVARLMLRVTVAGPAAVLGDTVPAALSEANLHGATVIVALVRTAFASGVSAASFQPVTTIPGLSVSSVSAVSAGDTQATLTLAFTGDFGGTRDLAVKVLAAAHTGSADLTTGTAPVTASPGVTLSRDSLALNEAPGTNNANRGTYTVALAAVPTGCTGGVGVAVASDNADVTVSPSTLTFTTSNWNTPQTVTATAAQDDADSNDDVATLSHSIATACAGAGYTTTLAIGSVTVTVADDEVGVAIVPTPATLTETNLDGATLALSLVNTTFAAGAPAAGVGAFELVSAIPNLSISQVSGVTAGGTTATLTLAFTGDFRGQPPLAVRVPAASHQGAGVLTSNEVAVTGNPGVTVSKTSLSLAEDPGTTNANRGTYTIVPDSPPTGCTGGVGIAVASNNADVTANPAARTFTASNWNTAQTVTVTAAQDDDGADDAATLSHSIATACDGAGYPASFAIGSLSVAVDDNETPAVVIDADPSTANVVDTGPLTLTEGHATDAAKTYSVRLSTPPTQAVTVTLTSADAGAVSIDDVDGDSSNGVQHTLTFTSSTWETAQTVTARAADDDNATDESVALGAAASTATTSEYTGVTASLTATVDDNETRAVTLSASTLTVPENNSATYTAKLAAQPVGGNVTVTITGAGSGITVDTDGGTTGEQDTLTFTPQNWSTVQTVTVRAAADANAVTESVTLTHTATGADYGGVAAALVATTMDSDTPSLYVSPTELTVDEGSSATYAVRLNTEPSAAVTVTVSGATTEVTVDVDAATGNQNTLTFTMTTWATARMVTVSAAEDDDATNETLTLSHAASGGDYTGLAAEARPSVAVTVTDVDTRAVTLGGGVTQNRLTVPENGTATYTVVLATEPTGPVTVRPSLADGGDADLTLPPPAPVLTFAATNWQTAQTVTVAAAADDGDAVNGTATLNHAVSGADYGASSVTVPAVTVTEADDETPTLAIAGATVTEGAAGATTPLAFTVTLTLASPQAVTVAYADAGTGTATADADYTALAAGTLTFAAGTTTHTISVSVTGDAVDEADETIQVTLSNPTGGAALGTAPTGTGTITDDDTRGVTVSAATSGLGVTENSTATYTVVLTSQPTGPVTVTVGGTGDDVTVDVAAASGNQNVMTFSATTWATAQTVTVAAAEDGNSDGERVTLTHTVTGADYGANSVTAADVAVTVTDNDVPGLDVTPTTVTVTEGGTATYTVRLTTEPSGAVTVAVATTATATATVAPSTLTFSTTTWATAQTVTVTGTTDADATTNEQATVTHAPTGASEYTSLAANARPNVTVTVTDVDVRAVTLGGVTQNRLTVPEGGTATYTVVLATEPTGSVTVRPSFAAGGDADLTLPAAPVLTFAATNWQTAQTVTVAAAADDGDAVNGTATLTHAVSGADYGATSVTVPAVTVTEADDETPTLAIAGATVDEGDAGATTPLAFTVTLTPASPQVVTVAYADAGTGTATAGTDYTALSSGTLTFAVGATTHTISVSVMGDAVDEADETIQVTLSSPTGGAALGTAPTGTGTITDDDALPAVTLAVSSTAVTEHGGVATVTATLSGQSSEAVVLTVTASPVTPAVAGDFTLSMATTLTIAAETTTSTGLVTVTAVDNDVDADADNKDVTVSATATGGRGVANPTSVMLTLTDDDVAGIAVSPATSTTSPLRTTESGSMGGTATFTVTLATKPTGTVVLDVASSDTGEGTVSPSSLTFTAMDWNTAQTVTLTGVDDAPTPSDPNPATGTRPYTVTLTVNAVSTLDAKYDALGPPPTPAVTVYAVNADNEYGLDVPVTSGLTTTEDGGTATFTVALRTQPSAAVTVTVTSDDPTEGTASPSLLVFTTQNWNTARSVVVTGVDDDVDDEDQDYTVVLDPSSGDANYHGLDNVPVSVTTTDNDDVPTVTLSVTPAAITEDGGVATVTATLSHPSNQAVTLTVTAAPTPGTGTDGTDFDLSTDKTLTIAVEGTTSAGLVTITAVDNDVHSAANKQVTVSATATGGTVDASATVTLTITDDDTPGLKIDPIKLVLEEATTDQADAKPYTVRLATKPTAAVTVTVAVTVTNGHLDAVTVAPTTLTFTETDWATAQPVTVTAGRDPRNDYQNEKVTLTHKTSGASEYDVLLEAEHPRVTVTVIDKDTPPTLWAGDDTTINGHRVTVTATRAEATPAVAVEVTPSGETDGAIEVVIRLYEGDPNIQMPDGGRFFLGSFDQPTGRTAVDITVTSAGSPLTAANRAKVLGDDGLTICLPVSQALWAKAVRLGRNLALLHQNQNGEWEIRPGPTDPDLIPPSLHQNQNDEWEIRADEEYRADLMLCTTLLDFSPFVVAINGGEEVAFKTDGKNAKRSWTFPTGRAVRDGAGDLPGATGDGTITYELTPITLPLPAGLTYEQPKTGAEHGGTITGTPTTPTDQREYTLTATDVDREEVSITITIEVKPGIQSRDLGLVLAGIGRTLATDAVEILGNRFGSPPASRLQITLGGQVLRLTNPTASPSPSSPSPSSPTSSPLSPTPSPLAGEGRGEGEVLRSEGSRPQGQPQESTARPAGSPSPWQQATGLAIGVARALGVAINTPPPHSPSPLAGEGRGEGGFLQGEGAILQGEGGFPQNEATLLGRFPTDLRRATTTASPLRIQPVSGKDLLARSAFELPLTRTGDDGIPAWTLWGRGSAAGFSGQPEADFKMDGRLYSGYVGLDYRPQSTVLLGLAVAHSTGEVNYERTEATKAGADVELTSVLPYAHWQPRPGLGVWGLAGVGWGEMDLKLVGDPQTYTTGLTSWLGAVGGRQALTTWQGIDLAAKTDAFMTTVRSAGKTNLPAARGHAQRVRLVVEGRTAVDLSPVSRLEPRLELGGRWDNGTAEQGLGAELGGGVAYTRTDWGLSVAAQGRYLLLHEDGAFEDWGASLNVRLDPGVAGEGAYLTVAPVWGQASSGVEQLWGTAAVLPQASGPSRPATGWQPGSLEVDLGYGLALADGRGFLTPYGGLALAGPGSSRYRLGSRLALSSSLDVTLEGERAEQPGQKTAHGVSVRLGWQW